MELHEAFVRAVRKYYEGFDYASTKGALGGEFKYDHGTLQELHEQLVPKRRKPKEEPELIEIDDEEDESEEFIFEDDE